VSAQREGDIVLKTVPQFLDHENRKIAYR
jgi:hypothetical protein